MECFWFESGLNKQQGYRNTVGGKKKNNDKAWTTQLASAITSKFYK